MEVNKGLIKENSELRKVSRQQLNGRWGTVILLCFIFFIVTWLLAFIPYAGSIISLIICGPLELGLISCFLKLIREEEFRFENLFDGFKNFTSAFLLELIMSIFILLWSLLLIIPGIIAAYRYSMAFYILDDNPELGAMDALKESKKMMIGYKGKLFLLHLSFIGWTILSVLTLGIGFLWLIPYINTSTANFYENLKDASKPETLSSGL